MKLSITRSHIGNRRSQSGFTLIEMLVAVAFIGLLGALVTATVFATRKSEVTTNMRINVADQVARATTWLSRDGRSALSSDLVDGAAAVSTATFQVSNSGVVASCNYSLNGASLTRTCGGAPAVVATNISGLTFSKTGKLVAASFDVGTGVEARSVALKVLEGGW